MAVDLRIVDKKGALHSTKTMGHKVKKRTEQKLDHNYVATSQNCGAYSGAAFITFFVTNAALIRGRRLIGDGGYSSKYGTRQISDSPRIQKCCLAT